MADVQILYGESVAATTATSTTWVDVASISSGSFTAGKKYLILANQVQNISSASQETRVRLVHGTTPTEFTDASLAYEGVNAAMEHQLSYMYMYTQPGTPETIKLQISVSLNATVTNILSQIIAINMDDLGTDGTDYFWNEDLADYTMTATPTAKATTASFTPNGTDRWLFIGHMIYDVVTIVDQIGFELYDSVAGVLNKGWVEGEDATNDFKGFNLYWVGTPTNAARTLAVRPVEEAGSNIMLASRVIAINLAKFAQSASTFDATEVNPASSPSWTTLATIAPTPTNTGNWVVIAFLTSDINESAGDIETRLQINPSGGGLADSPAYTNTAPGNDAQDPLDETPFTVFNLVSLSSGGARTINYDARRTAGTTGRIEDNGLVAFSVALGTSNVTITLDTATLAATGQALTVVEGAVTKTLSTASLTATGRAITVSAPPAAITITLSTATVSAQGRALSVVPGAVSKTLTTAAMTATGRALSVVPGAMTKAINTATLTASGQALSVVPGAVTKSLTTALLQSTGQALSVVPGAFSLALNTAIITASGQTIQVGNINIIALSTATLVANGQALSVVPGEVSKALSTAQITANGQTITVSAGAGVIQITLDTAQLLANGQAASLIPGAVTKALTTALLQSTGQTLGIVPGAMTLVLDTASLTSTGNNIIVVPGSVIIPVNTANLFANGQTVNISAVSGLVIILDTASLTASGQSIAMRGYMAMIALSLAERDLDWTLITRDIDWNAQERDIDFTMPERVLDWTLRNP